MACPTSLSLAAREPRPGREIPTSVKHHQASTPAFVA